VSASDNAQANCGVAVCKSGARRSWSMSKGHEVEKGSRARAELRPGNAT
jgi:hypothetical protein